MKQVFGGILIAVGILVGGASGLCSLAVLFGGGFGPSDLSMLPLVLVVGGIPFAIGCGIGFAGWALIKSARREREPDLGDTFE